MPRKKWAFSGQQHQAQFGLNPALPGGISGPLTFKALSTLSPKTATVAEKCDCRRKRRDNGDSRRIRRLSHFSATRRRFLRQSLFSAKSATIVASVDSL